MNSTFVLKVLFLMFISISSFASPFDVTDVDQSDLSKVIKEKDEKVLEDIEIKILPKFKDVNDAKFTILNIIDAQKQIISVHINEIKNINDIQLTLKKCQLEIDNFMNKISIATIEVSSKHSKIQNFTVTSNADDAIVIDNKFLVTVNCSI